MNPIMRKLSWVRAPFDGDGPRLIVYYFYQEELCYSDPTCCNSDGPFYRSSCCSRRYRRGGGSGSCARWKIYDSERKRPQLKKKGNKISNTSRQQCRKCRPRLEFTAKRESRGKCFWCPWELGCRVSYLRYVAPTFGYLHTSSIRLNIQGLL